MYIFVLLLTLYVFIANIRGYKTLFTPKDILAKDFRDKLKEVKKISPYYELGVFLGALIITVPHLIFYIIAANVFIENKILLLYSILKLFLCLISMKKFISFALNEDKKFKRGFLTTILHPINTVFIIYFGYVYVMSI